jgi:hypothetical protein
VRAPSSTAPKRKATSGPPPGGLTWGGGEGRAPGGLRDSPGRAGLGRSCLRVARGSPPLWGGDWGEFLTCRVRVPEQCSALCSPRRNSAALMGRTLEARRRPAAWSILMSPSVPPLPARCLPAYPYSPEHHLDGRFWPLCPLLQAPRGVPVAAARVTIPAPSLSVLWRAFRAFPTVLKLCLPIGRPAFLHVLLCTRLAPPSFVPFPP